MWSSLQPYVIQPATLCDPACNPMWSACQKEPSLTRGPPRRLLPPPPPLPPPVSRACVSNAEPATTAASAAAAASGPPPAAAAARTVRRASARRGPTSTEQSAHLGGQGWAWGVGLGLGLGLGLGMGSGGEPLVVAQCEGLADVRARCAQQVEVHAPATRGAAA